MTTIPLTLVTPRGRAAGPAWQVDGSLTVSVDTGCELRALHPDFSRCSTCPLPACWVDYSVADRNRAARMLRQLGATPPRL